LRVALACPSGAAAACRGTLRVTRSGRPLAAARFTVAPGARRTVTLRLRRADRRALRRARGLRVTFTVRGPGPTTRATRRLVAG
jgi:hypothetical protein